MADWLPTLKTDSPQGGYDLAVTLARKAVGMTQSDGEVRKNCALYMLTVLRSLHKSLQSTSRQPPRIITGMTEMYKPR